MTSIRSVQQLYFVNALFGLIKINSHYLTIAIALALTYFKIMHQKITPVIIERYQQIGVVPMFNPGSGVL